MRDEKLSSQLEIVITDPATLIDSNKTEWNIRNLNPNDLNSVCQICREAFPLEYSDSWFSEVCSGRFIAFGLFYFGELSGLIVAELKLLANCDIEDQGIGRKSSDSVVYIMSLATTHKYRRKGIATLLLNHLKTTVLDKPPFPTIVFLHVLSTNLGAICFYKRNGFSHYSTLMNYYMINGIYYEGLTFIRCVNGKKPPCSVKEFCNVIAATITLPFRYLLKLRMF